MVLSRTRSQCIWWESGWLWTGVETFHESFGFPDGKIKNLFIASLLILNHDQVKKVCWVNLVSHIFLKKINSGLIVFFLPMLIFFEKNALRVKTERHCSHFRNQFFLLPNHGGHFYIYFFCELCTFVVMSL